MNTIDKIRAEIERRNLANYCGTAEQYEEELFSILDTLEPVSDCHGLEEEVKRYYSENFSYITSDNPTLSILTNIARHFYELGRNARKEK